MDQVTTTTAASQASSQITEAYNWGGRQRAQFQADQDRQAKATGTDNMQLGFKDMLDFINPLQHIPVVRNIYQAVTGDDTMKPAVKTAGDTLYGGPLGAVSSVVDNIIKDASGKDIPSTLASWAGLSSDNGVQTASAKAPSSAVTASAAAAPAAPVATAVAVNGASAPQANPKIINFAASPTGPNAPAGTMQTAAAVPSSPLFNHLQKGAAPQGQVLGAAQQKFFNPTANQYAGVKPASYHAPANTNALAAAASAAPTQAAAIASNAAIAGSANAGPADGAPAPQSEFAQKMMAAMDRYEAAKKTGDNTAAPAVSAGL